ncbi:MAG: Ig-like domain-containing protein [Candidatus Fimenecus sp.]
MQKTQKRFWSVLLSAVLLLTALLPGFTVLAASATIIITQDGEEVTERLEVQEYRSIQLDYITEGDVPEGAYVTWESNLPLLAGVDETGKVTGYDYSKAAIITKWLDENVRPLPLVGDALADEIENQIQAKCDEMGVDLDDLNNDTIVAIVRALAGDTLADSLQNALDNMNVEITATLCAADGSVLATDMVEVVVTKSVIANVAPTGVHITNKNSVPTTVAVGAQVQLYGVCTPVRLHEGVKWTVGSTIFDSESSKHANVTSDGLVTFTSAGTATVRLNPESTAYSAFTDKITFTVLEPEDLPVEDFNITGTLKVDEGATTQLAITDLTPAGAYTGDLVWESSDPSVAAVDQSGLVTGLDGGSGAFTYSKTATITATIGGISKSVEVTVNRKLLNSTISGIEIIGEPVIPNNASSTYTIQITPDRLNTSSSVVREWGMTDPLTEEVIWATADTPADTSLATLTADGVLTPKQSGIMIIHARATQGEVVLETEMTVTAGNAITDFEITGDTDIFEGTIETLRVDNISPEDYDTALLQTVVWTSSDPSIAVVDEKGAVYGVDAGGLTIFHTKKVTITATIGGISRSVEVTIRGNSVNTLTSATIYGSDYVIKDFPRTYTATFSPSRISVKNVHWGVPTDAGARPWTSAWSSTEGNQQNAIATVDNNGVVYGNSAGTTDLYVFGREGATKLDGSYVEDIKTIQIVELEPDSITLTAPTRKNYVEGETELDLTGLKVVLNYNKEDISRYYDTTDWTDSDFSVEVTDYTISEINQKILDNEQYILVSVTRAGETYRGVFPIVLESKKVTSIDLVNPRYIYSEGETELDLEGLEVTANYSNAESELVTDYLVDDDMFDPTLLDVEQQIPVTYTHEGLSATATFPVIIYGTPVLRVDTGDYAGGWTPNDVTFTLSATHPMDAITYFYRTDSNPEWIALDGDTLTVDENIQETYYFKAINSVDVESAESQGYTVQRDDISPDFTLTPAETKLINQSFAVSIDGLSIGASGVQSVTLNGTDITEDYSAFIVDENGIYTVKVTAGNGLFCERTVEISNIDKIVPTVTEVDVQHKNSGGFARFISELTYGKFFNEEIELTIEATDEGVSGIAKVEYRWYDADTDTYSDWAMYDAQNKPTQAPSFRGYAEARATDAAGNVSAVVTSDGVTVDGTKPSIVKITATYNDEIYQSSEWVADDVVLTLESNAYSGIYAYQYRVDGGAWLELSGNTLTATEEGRHVYEFRALSNAGLYSAATVQVVQIDRQKPVIRVEFDGTFGRWTAQGARFNFSTEAESLSGITYYYSDGTGWYEFDGSELNLTQNTNAVYCFKAVNGAGTESTTSDSYRVMIDTTEPDIILTPTVTEPTETPYLVNYKAIVGPSGLASVTIDGCDITQETSFIVVENGNYLVTVTGNNGRAKTVLLTISNFPDNTATPILQVGVSGALGVQTDKPITFTLSTPNYTSGITYYYSTGEKWVKLSGDTLTIDSETKATYTFKAVNQSGVESYVSPAYEVWFEKTEIKQILPNEDGSTDITVDRSQGTTYLVGLNAENTSVAELKANLQNEDTQIIVRRGDTVLTDSDAVGTGCVVQCVSVKDVAVIYESATVILYGDVNGDGLIDETDYRTMSTASLVDSSAIGDGVYSVAADLNGDGVVDFFDVAMLNLHLSGTCTLDQTAQLYK